MCMNSAPSSQSQGGSDAQQCVLLTVLCHEAKVHEEVDSFA